MNSTLLRNRNRQQLPADFDDRALGTLLRIAGLYQWQKEVKGRNLSGYEVVYRESGHDKYMCGK